MQVGQRERGQPPGGELDGQRHPVEPADDVGDHRQLRRVPPGTLADPGLALEEDGDGRDSGDVRLLIRERQRRQPEDVLGRETERFPAGGEHGEPRAGRQHGVDGVADRVQQMFAVVDQQQPLAVAEHGQAGAQHVTLHDIQVQRRGQRVRNGGRFGDGRQQHRGRRFSVGLRPGALPPGRAGS